MGKVSKNYKAALAKIEEGKQYQLLEACNLVKTLVTTKFDSSVDIDIRLGVDPKKANQMVRGVVTLPNGTGKDKKVLVLCTPDKEDEAKAAGADYFRKAGPMSMSSSRCLRAWARSESSVGFSVPVASCLTQRPVLLRWKSRRQLKM